LVYFFVLGTKNTAFVTSTLNLLLSNFQPPFEPFTYPVIEGFNISEFAIDWIPGFGNMGFNLEYDDPIPGARLILPFCCNLN
jgi:hypothetical protein